MKTRFFLILVLMLGLILVTSQALLAQMSKTELQSMYMGFLKDEGFSPEINSTGAVIFKYEGGSYAIIVDETDSRFFGLVYPNFYSIENEAERIKVLKAADYANEKSKVAKIYIMRNNTWATIELFLSSADQFKPVFRRSLDALRNGIANFATKMREL